MRGPWSPALLIVLGVVFTLVGVGLLLASPPRDTFHAIPVYSAIVAGLGIVVIGFVRRRSSSRK